MKRSVHSDLGRGRDAFAPGEARFLFGSIFGGPLQNAVGRLLGMGGEDHVGRPGDQVAAQIALRRKKLSQGTHLAPDGIIVANITNKFFDLSDVIRNQAGLLGMEAVQVLDEATEFYEDSCRWVVVTSNREFLDSEGLRANLKPWPRPEPKAVRWTDRFSNLFSVIYWDKNELIGPAFINAYRLESDVAKHSRVVLSSGLNREIRNLFDHHESDLTDHLRKNFRRDVDGYIIFDPNVMWYDLSLP